MQIRDLTQISRGKYCIMMSTPRILCPSLGRSESILMQGQARPGRRCMVGKAFSSPPSLIVSVSCLQCDGHWSCLRAGLLCLLASPQSCQQGETAFHNPSLQAPTRLLEGEECAGENIPTAVKRHSFPCPFLGWPFLH